MFEKPILFLCSSNSECYCIKCLKKALNIDYHEDCTRGSSKTKTIQIWRITCKSRTFVCHFPRHFKGKVIWYIIIFVKLARPHTLGPIHYCKQKTKSTFCTFCQEKQVSICKVLINKQRSGGVSPLTHYFEGS